MKGISKNFRRAIIGGLGGIVAGTTLLFVSWLSGCESGEKRALSESEIVRNFELLAFSAEKVVGGEDDHRLSKWTTDIRVGLAGKDALKYDDQVAEVLSELSSITGHPVGFYGDEKPNVLAIISPQIQEELQGDYRRDVEMILANVSPEELLELFPRGPKCIAYVTHIEIELPSREEPLFVPGLALVLIDTSRGEKITRQCIIEEFTHVMGLLNDDDTIENTIFNGEDFESLSYYDRLYLEILYDPLIEVGMSRSQAHPLVERIVKRKLSKTTP